MGEPIKEYRLLRRSYPDDQDIRLEPGVMHIFLYDEEPQAVDFLCPCGCGSECYIVLVTKDRFRSKGSHPIWDFSYGPNGPTLSPSIRYMSGCRAHFNITDGKVIIHGDSGK